VTPKVKKVKKNLGNNINICIVFYHLQRLRVKGGVGWGEEGTVNTIMKIRVS